MMVAVGSGGRGGAPRAAASSYRRREKYLWFVLPAVVVIVAVIIFPWIFTVFMSLHDWQVASPRTWVGLDNYANLLSDERFRAAIGRTFVYTLLAVVFPVVIGTAAAILFHREFPLRGFLRSIYILPMVATPVAIALVWTMMFHPQLGVFELPVDPCRSPALAVGLFTADRHSVVGSGGNVAVDAAGDADRAWRFGDAADRTAGICCGRRRRRLADPA